MVVLETVLVETGLGSFFFYFSAGETTAGATVMDSAEETIFIRG